MGPLGRAERLKKEAEKATMCRPQSQEQAAEHKTMDFSVFEAFSAAMRSLLEPGET